MTLDLAAGYRALRESVAAVRLPRDVVLVSGPDTLDYLQGQLSQEVTAVRVGGSAWSFVLQPQGKVDAVARLTRVGNDVVLDTDGGWGEALVVRLRRFKLRVKVDVEPVAWACLALRGPAQGLAVAPAVPTTDVLAWANWPELPGVDLLGPDPALPAGVPEAGLDAWEVARIEAGIPVMGRELDEHTIPAEVAGLVDRAVSFTKGCFTGQELVARIDSRGGHVPRQLRGLIIDGPVPAAGTTLLIEGKQVGSVTSAARHPAGHAVALGYVRRQVAVPATAQTDGGGVARIAALPLLS